MSRPTFGDFVTPFTVYKFIQTWTTPYTQLPAYKLGIIDAYGNFIKSSDELNTQEERNAGNAYYRLIINLRKIIDDNMPNSGVKARLKNFPTAFSELMKEDIESMGGNSEEAMNQIYDFLESKNINTKELFGENDGRF